MSLPGQPFPSRSGEGETEAQPKLLGEMGEGGDQTTPWPDPGGAAVDLQGRRRLGAAATGPSGDGGGGKLWWLEDWGRR